MHFKNHGEIVGVVVEKKSTGEGKDTFRKIAVGAQQFAAPFEFFVGRDVFEACPAEGEWCRITFELQNRGIVGKGAGGRDQAKTTIKPIVKRIEAVAEGAIAGSTEDAGSGRLPKRRAA